MEESIYDRMKREQEEEKKAYKKHREAYARKVKKYIALGVTGFLLIVLLPLTIYIIPEGHVGVVKFWGKADYQVSPGINFKIPIANTVEKFDVRQRKNVEELTASSMDQLPLTAKTSINWTINKEFTMDLFIRYGGLRQFENRILDPKFRSATKAALARFSAHELIKDRQKAVDEIMLTMTEEMEGFPVQINSPQLENVTLPAAYLEAVESKEVARQDAVREEHKLEQQRLLALQKVNSADANAQAKRLEADAEAYRVITEATAEADAIQLINAQLARSPNYVELVKAKAWDGILPVTVLGDAMPMLQIK